MRELSIAERVRRKIANFRRYNCVPSRGTRGALSISFDDFPKTAWTIGGAILREYGVKGTYYVTGALCNHKWEGQQLYDAQDLHEIYEESHEIGSHLYDHISVLRLSEIELRKSIARNDQFVRDQLDNYQMTTFAYPYGDVSVAAKQICAGAFAACRGIGQGINGRSVELAQLKCTDLVARSTSAFWEDLVLEAARSKSWLVVVTHDIDENPSPFGCRPKDLQRLLQLAQAADLSILPVKSALAEVVLGGRGMPAGPASTI
jgi:peptidoglycan/xylan/chitin deacetylase (PgdA/CDA1 family)